MSLVERVFDVRFEVDGAELAATGPVLVFVRHASIVDVLVPAAFVANRHRIELRYVLKRELLVDPCLDVAGHWLPNVFVDRAGGDSERQIARVAALASGIGPTSGVVVFPEGTRFTEAKRRAILERAAPDVRAQAERLRHLLPIRAGGPLALLEASPGADVLFVGHQGLDGLASIADVWAGDLVGRVVRVKLWREPAATIPSVDRLAWLTDRWQRLDDWLADG